MESNHGSGCPRLRVPTETVCNVDCTVRYTTYSTVLCTSFKLKKSVEVEEQEISKFQIEIIHNKLQN